MAKATKTKEPLLLPPKTILRVARAGRRAQRGGEDRIFGITVNGEGKEYRTNLAVGRTLEMKDRVRCTVRCVREIRAQKVGPCEKHGESKRVRFGIKTRGRFFLLLSPPNLHD